MSVVFDLTVIGPELLDAVIFMEKSPAYAAFKEEVEKILADFNKTSKFGQNVEIDVKNLVEASTEAVKNMHRAYLIWTFHEDMTSGAKNPQYNTFLKLFFKGQEKYIIAANGGKKTIDAKEAADVKDKYIAEIPAIRRQHIFVALILCRFQPRCWHRRIPALAARPALILTDIRTW